MVGRARARDRVPGSLYGAAARSHSARPPCRSPAKELSACRRPSLQFMIRQTAPSCVSTVVDQ
eukprot:2149985-Prymnesium_polylepis.1